MVPIPRALVVGQRAFQTSDDAPFHFGELAEALEHVAGRVVHRFRVQIGELVGEEHALFLEPRTGCRIVAPDPRSDPLQRLLPTGARGRLVRLPRLPAGIPKVLPDQKSGDSLETDLRGVDVTPKLDPARDRLRVGRC